MEVEEDRRRERRRQVKRREVRVMRSANAEAGSDEETSIEGGHGAADLSDNSNPFVDGALPTTAVASTKSRFTMSIFFQPRCRLDSEFDCLLLPSQDATEKTKMGVASATWSTLDESPSTLHLILWLRIATAQHSTADPSGAAARRHVAAHLAADHILHYCQKLGAGAELERWMPPPIVTWILGEPSRWQRFELMLAAGVVPVGCADWIRTGER
ncbi:hypothetical protein MUK42_35897 [Musa troglodytarum]|uniref:Uncharacterized protein n=1 Tax=Musa troglodytarum TaxID=320322 RepID=A0A9E7J9F7_9LILI|nr:hypothetical protein MUK42_35897 [Musa troglodytarum]